MADSNVNPYVAEVFKLAHVLAPPLVANLQGQPKSNTPVELDARFSQRLYENSLNGSGPSDPTLASQSSPITMLDQITGREASANPITPTNSGMSMTWIAVAIAVIATFILLRR